MNIIRAPIELAPTCEWWKEGGREDILRRELEQAVGPSGRAAAEVVKRALETRDLLTTTPERGKAD